MEVWKDVPGYEGLYMISSYGRVKSLDRFVLRKDGRKNHYHEKILVECKDNKGYSRICLTKDGESKTYLVHRLVATAFIPNPSELPQVNHKNEDKSANNVDNLEWMSCIDNANHATGKIRCGKAHEFPVVMIDSDGTETVFSSATSAASELGIVSQGIQSCCAGRFPTYKGMRWRYLNRHRAIEVR